MSPFPRRAACALQRFRCGQLCCTTRMSSLNTKQQMQQLLVSRCPVPWCLLRRGCLLWLCKLGAETCLQLAAGRLAALRPARRTDTASTLRR